MSNPDTANSLPDVLHAIKPCANGWQAEIPASWLQGRTCYGGLSSAITHHAARLLLPDAPPLRSAQIGFVGPIAAGPAVVTAALLRQGKNSAIIETRILSDGAVGHTAQFIFMSPRESVLQIACPPPATKLAPPVGDAINGNASSWYTRHMEYSDKRAQFGIGAQLFHGWHRLTARDGLDVMTELLCIADALPPAAMAHTMIAKPVSSMNWQLNMLASAPATRDGWWLLESEVHHSHHGSSSQYMGVYDADLRPVMKGMQAIAVFG